MTVNNKRGMAPETLGEIIIVIAGCLIITVFVLSFLSFLAPTLSSFACGVNVGAYASVVSSSKGTLDAPIIMCNQYREPVKINAADFKACQGIAPFCKDAKDEIRDECYRQCARIQVDALTDACWAMGGKGDKDLRGPFWKNLSETVGAVVGEIAGHIGAALATASHTIAAAGIVATPYVNTAVKILSPNIYSGAIAELSISSAAKYYDANQQKIAETLAPKRQIVLKCSRFQIVNPARTSAKPPQPFTLEDNSLGHSPAIALSDAQCASLGSQPGVFNPKAIPVQGQPEQSLCYLGGSGVAAVREDTPGSGISDMRRDVWPRLNYEITSPRQICYISYHHYASWENHRQGEDAITRYAVTRSCKTWNPFPGVNSRFLN